MIIRPLQISDIEAVIEIVSSHVSEDGPFARSYFQAFFTRLVAGAKLEQNYVAENDLGCVIGVCGYGPDQYDTPDILWLKWFYVRKDYVGTMVGFRLYEQVLNDLRKLGTRKLYLDTSSYTAYNKAVRFYRSAGFVQEGLLLDYYGPAEHMLIMGVHLS